jgi:hypothetical protein
LYRRYYCSSLEPSFKDKKYKYKPPGKMSNKTKFPSAHFQNIKPHVTSRPHPTPQNKVVFGVEGEKNCGQICLGIHHQAAFYDAKAC